MTRDSIGFTEDITRMGSAWYGGCVSTSPRRYSSAEKHRLQIRCSFKRCWILGRFLCASLKDEDFANVINCLDELCFEQIRGWGYRWSRGILQPPFMLGVRGALGGSDLLTN